MQGIHLKKYRNNKWQCDLCKIKSKTNIRTLVSWDIQTTAVILYIARQNFICQPCFCLLKGSELKFYHLKILTGVQASVFACNPSFKNTFTFQNYFTAICNNESFLNRSAVWQECGFHNKRLWAQDLLVYLQLVSYFIWTQTFYL